MSNVVRPRGSAVTASTSSSPADWPTLRKHGLEPLLAGAGPVTFENGIIHPEVHAQLEKDIRPYIDSVADQGAKTIITIGGQRRNMPYEQAADNAVAFLNRIKGHLEDRGVTIAIENMNNRRLDPRFGREDQTFGRWGWGVGVCERVNSQNVKLVCDLYHLQIMDGDIAQNIRDTIQWIAHFHTAGVPSRNEIDFSQEMNYRYIAEVIADTAVHGLREPRVAADSRSRSVAQHRRSARDHGRLNRTPRTFNASSGDMHE